MMKLWSRLRWLLSVLRFQASVSRLEFFVALLVCLVLKQGVDRLILKTLGISFNGHIWGVVMGGVLPNREDLSWAGPLLAASLPFVWAGLALTAGRLRAMGRSVAWALLFFVPVVKFLFALLLIALPDSAGVNSTIPPRLLGGASRWFGWIPRGRWEAAAVGACLSAVFGALSIFLITQFLEAYGWALFVALPLLIGFLTTLVQNHHELQKPRESILATLAALALLGGILIMAAIEGLICLLMASPIAVVLAVIGSMLAQMLISQRWVHRKQEGRLFSVGILFIPLVVVTEWGFRGPPEIRPVVTELTIAAPPETVWRHVVSFSDLPPPTEWMFQTGIAYPIRARLEGRGVGAIRYCEFSTGSFEEPIEVWDEPRRLAFSVTAYPAPMEEWTPYRHIHPPHLDGFFVSKRGQFELKPTNDGGTRLVGTTWYQHGLLPESYWRLWSDAVLHRIHGRVLNHIRSLAEAESSRR